MQYVRTYDSCYVLVLHRYTVELSYRKTFNAYNQATLNLKEIIFKNFTVIVEFNAYSSIFFVYFFRFGLRRIDLALSSSNSGSESESIIFLDLYL